MSTLSIVDYALMAGASYISTRAAINQFPIPSGWMTVTNPPHFKDDVSGFEAVAFTDGTNVVISFAGTDPNSPADKLADANLALGAWSTQLGEAAAYYLQIKAANSKANITFTGHSLGGGLAALLSVFFGNTSKTFDQAPFGASATTAMRDQLVAYLEQHGYSQQQLADLAPALMATNFDPATGAMNVTNVNVAGEFLSTEPWNAFSRIGTSTDISDNAPGVTGTDLHSIALLTAFEQSQQTATAYTTNNVQETLNNVTSSLPDLLKMIFDKNLFAFDTDTKNTKNPNFLEDIVNHQAGLDPVTQTAITSGSGTAGDNMVTRFTTDLWQIAQAGGLTMTDKNVTDTLIAFAMQSYYEGANAADKTGTKHLFNSIAGGLEFAITDVSKGGNLLTNANGVGAKGYAQYFLKNILTDNTDINFTYLSNAERKAIRDVLPTLQDWFIQAGTTGMYATASDTSSAFMLGGNGNNVLAGGAMNDLLVASQNGSDTLNGGAGNDTLIAGSGRDFLVGGEGNDTIYAGSGFDTINLERIRKFGQEAANDETANTWRVAA